MAILRAKDVAKMKLKEIEDKIKELRIEMIKARVAGKKGGKSNLREIKRTIARLLTASLKLKLNAEVKSK